ncbi:serine/threonine-protein kinase [Streptomyces cavernae]|uniref:serine/threonine-protein kinase n=1 Tax=Streptomyces cavernae TaxID=2259034 RepID=UPI000FEBAB69|nr:serine/threonine-protein kinase [Streptomyces cavernae]
MQGLLIAGRYRLVDSIGSGGMGRVWRAQDELLHRAVAIKELTAALYVTERDRAVLLTRTQTEARAAARINHDAVVTVHDVLEHDGRPWIVMELVEGGSLADAIQESGQIEPREAARVGLWVLRALRAAHAAGVLHRDIKPGNVLLAADGRVKLTDFGIAQVEGDTTITRTGEIVGSVDYLAPERIRGADPGPSSDLWSLGATLYTAVEGLSPFRRTTPLTTMQAVVGEEPEPPRHAGPLTSVITSLLSKEPDARPSAEELELMLAEAAEGRESRTVHAYVPTMHVPTGEHDSGASHVIWPPAGGATPDPAPGPEQLSTAANNSATVDGPGKRRLRRALVIVAALAALAGGGVAALMAYGERDGNDSVVVGDDGKRSASPTEGTSPKGEPSPTKSPTAPAGSLPDGWVRVTDPEGFSLALPKGWQRQVNGTQIDYTPDNGKHFVRIAVDDAPDFDSAFGHLRDLEVQVTPRLPEYARISLEENVYRDRPGALWDFTWTAVAADPFPGPRRAIEQSYISRDGVEYLIYMSSPAEDWATTRDQFDTILRSWRQPGES